MERKKQYVFKSGSLMKISMSSIRIHIQMNRWQELQKKVILSLKHLRKFGI